MQLADNVTTPRSGDGKSLKMQYDLGWVGGWVDLWVCGGIPPHMVVIKNAPWSQSFAIS